MKLYSGIALVVLGVLLVVLLVVLPKPSKKDEHVLKYDTTGRLNWSPSYTETPGTVNTGIMWDGPNRFAVVENGKKIWSGTPEQFMAMVHAGLRCADGTWQTP